MVREFSGIRYTTLMRRGDISISLSFIISFIIPCINHSFIIIAKSVEIIERDTNGITLRLSKEDHTLGNMIATWVQ